MACSEVVPEGPLHCSSCLCERSTGQVCLLIGLSYEDQCAEPDIPAQALKLDVQCNVAVHSCLELGGWAGQHCLQPPATASQAVSHTSPCCLQGLVIMGKRDGLRGMFKGNGTNCVRIIPNSAVKFMTYEQLSR